MEQLQNPIPHPIRSSEETTPRDVFVTMRSPVETFFSGNIDWIAIGFKFGCGFAVGMLALSIAIGLGAVVLLSGSLATFLRAIF